MPTMEELKNRLSNLNRRTSKQNDLWKPKDEHQVRLLPYQFGDDPFLELHFHYEVGDNGTILCPKANFGKDCAVCDFCAQLAAWKDANGNDKPKADKQADFEIFKKIQPKARVFVPCVERGKESEGPKFWGVTPNQANEILKVCADGDRLGELGIAADDASAKALQVIIGTEKAYDLKVSFAKPGEKGNTKTFAQVTIEAKIKTSPLMPDKKAAKDLLGQMKNIRDVYPEVSSAEVKKMLDKFVGSTQPEAKAEGGTEKYAPHTKEDAKVQGGRTIDEAFGDMVAED